jgi:MoxR-like ATPase
MGHELSTTNPRADDESHWKHYRRVALIFVRRYTPTEVELRSHLTTLSDIKRTADENISDFIQRFQDAFYRAHPGLALHNEANYDRFIRALDKDFQRHAHNWVFMSEAAEYTVEPGHIPINSWDTTSLTRAYYANRAPRDAEDSHIEGLAEYHAKEQVKKSLSRNKLADIRWRIHRSLRSLN